MSNVAYTPNDASRTVPKPRWYRRAMNRPVPSCLSVPRASASTIALLVLLILPLTACRPVEPPIDPNGTFGSSVTAMDYDPSDTHVPNVFVDGTWVGEGGRGGKIVLGGIKLPKRWHPGLTADVRWQRCDRLDPKHPVPLEEACHWTEKVVPIHRYDEVGRTWLHILPGDRVLIIPSMLGPGHPDYPGPDLPTKDFFGDSSVNNKSKELAK